MKNGTILELKASLRDAKVRERKAQDMYETAKHERITLESAIYIIQDGSDKR